MITWNDFSNGELLGTIRSMLNTFNESVEQAVNGNITSINNNTSNIVVNANATKITVRDGVDVDTLITKGLYQVNTNLPGVATAGQVQVNTYTNNSTNPNRRDQHFVDDASGAIWNRDSLLGDGSDWTAWAQVSIETTSDFIGFIPQATEPQTDEGTMYYEASSHTFVALDDIAGTKLNLGHELVERAYNDTAAIIYNGRVVAVGGTDAQDEFEIVYGDASNLETSVCFGVTTSELAVGEVGKVTTKGRVNDIDTVGAAVNQPVYLSDVGDGSLTAVPPAITTVVGYVVKEQSGSGLADGTIYVSSRSIIALPNVVAFMNRNIATVPDTLDTVGGPITGFDVNDSGGIIMYYDVATGIIEAPADGIYDMTIDFATNYSDIGTKVQHLLIQVMGDNGVDIPTEVGRYNKEVAKNSTSTNGSMTKTFFGEKHMQYFMYISAPDDDFTQFVLENVSFSLKSIDIR